MKKLLFIISLISCALIVSAQDPQAGESVDNILGYGTDQSYVYYYGNASDTIGTGDSIWTYTVRVKSKFKLQPEIRVDIDSTGGTNDSVLVGLYSKTFADDPYILRESFTWYGYADTTYTMRSDSAHISEFWQLKMKGYSDDFKAELQELIFKVAEDR